MSLRAIFNFEEHWGEFIRFFFWQHNEVSLRVVFGTTLGYVLKVRLPAC